MVCADWGVKMITVKVEESIYWLENLWWTGPPGDDLTFLRIMGTYFLVNDVGGEDPDPDLTHALQALEELGQGEIIKNDPPTSVEGRVY